MTDLSGRFFAILTIVVALSSSSQGRAVNISNTWILPEEGFPVFYRHFRDRISWYEADAVCQFHHANLVTAETTSQYDAIRAYLIELDIRDNIWIGLSKTRDKPRFTWTDYRPLTGEGHWQEALPVDSDSLCAIMDPNADFLWRALPCGGPEIAAFICELPIPSWAEGPKGCLFTELPSLTVLYFPEQSTLELTSDCGLDGTRRIACKGNADREELLRQLSCAISSEDFDDRSTKSAPYSTSTDFSQGTTTIENDEVDNSLSDKTTKSWIWTSNTVDRDGDYGMPTRQRRETEDTLIPVSTRSSFKEDSMTTESAWNPASQDKPLFTTHRTSSSSTPTSQATVISSSQASAKNRTEKSENLKLISTMVTKLPTLTNDDKFSLTEISTITAELDCSDPLGKSLAKPKSSITQANVNASNKDKASTRNSVKTEQDKAVTAQDKSSEIKDKYNLQITDVRYEIYSTIASEVVSLNRGVSHNISTGNTIKDKTDESLKDTNSETTQKYPLLVDQRQALDTLANGTVFDIIELNGTDQTVQSESKIKVNSALGTSPSSPMRPTSNESTRALWNENPPVFKDEAKKEITSTEAPLKETLSTKYPKKYQLSATKKSLKDTNSAASDFPDSSKKVDKKNEEISQFVTKLEENEKLQFETRLDPATKLERELTKEFEMLPEIKDTSVKLNRTFRKDVPGESAIFKNLPESPEINILNELNSLADEAGERENIEISFHDETENANITETIVFSSIKRAANDSVKVEPDIVSILEHVENLDKSLDPDIRMIDPRLKILNQNLPRNNQSEVIKPMTIKRTEEWVPHRETEVVIPHPDRKSEHLDNSPVSKEGFLPKSLQKEVEIPPTEKSKSVVHTTEEFGPFPSDGPKKINRHRNLSKNNRKNFYPYFFSRMLG